MRYLFDVVHPAHVHFYRHVREELEAAGHETRTVARDKDVTIDLLTRLGIPHQVVGRHDSGGLLRLGAELVRRDLALWRIARDFDADVILTRNPAGVQAARLARIPGIFDTDDGRAVGVHFRAAAPFATVITSPAALADDFGAKHVTYPSFKALAFLHPSRFRPDPAVRAELGVDADEPYFIVRVVALAASHDRGESGLGADAKREVIRRLEKRGRVFVSSESALPADLADLALPVPVERVHDALAFARLCVTDGQSMAGEAAALGVPSVRYASSSGRLDVFRVLSERYGLVWEYPPGADEQFLDRVEVLADGGDADLWAQRRARLLDDTCDLTAWMLDFLDHLPHRPHGS